MSFKSRPRTERLAAALAGRLSVLLLLLAATAATSGCTGFATLSESLFMMTPQQEVQFGAQMAKEIAKTEEVVTDPAVVKYVEDVGRKVVANSPQSPVPLRFHVVKDDSINAFAIPGGDIYVNTGLLKAVDDEAELASVIAHEVGHAVRRHSARQISHTEGVNVIQQVISGNNTPQAAQAIGAVLAKGGLFKYSRDDEREADTIAVQTLYRAGYDPAAMRTFFGKLIQNYGDHSPATAWFATHPPTRERIANVDAVTKALPPRRYEKPTSDLRRVQGRLRQLGLVQ